MELLLGWIALAIKTAWVLIALWIALSLTVLVSADYRRYRAFRKKHPCDTLRPPVWSRPAR